MLQGYPIIAFVNTTDAKRAIGFYRDILGLRLLSEDQFAAVFDVNGTNLRVSIGQKFTPAPSTVLGWAVPDIRLVVARLIKDGAQTLRYDFMEQDSMGIWRSSSGAQVAWFHDPDKNVLSLTQF